MGKLILISGSNGSGKSAFAERLVGSIAAPRCYIATMVPHTEENRRRIEKHRRQRAGLGFTTLELPGHLSDAVVPEDGVVLLEDVSNLMANAMFDEGRDAKSVMEEILALSRRCRLLVAVTISGLAGEEYEGETKDYIAALRQVNDALFAVSCAAARMQHGEVIWEKGGAEDVG